MKTIFRAIPAFVFLAAASCLSASTCPSTSFTNSDCGFLITIGSTGMASVSPVMGADAFNGPQTFIDNTSDPGNDGSLVGVLNNDPNSLASFTLEGSGAGAGIFDFSFNGICVYTGASYCPTASTGYEGPTTTFTNLQSTVLFQTTEGEVDFNPGLGTGQSTYFSIEDNPSDITANGGLAVSDVMFNTTSTPEPAEMALVAAGLIGLSLFRRRLSGKR